MVRRWGTALLTALCGVLVAATKIYHGEPVSAVLLLVLCLGLAFVASPLAFPRSSSGDVTSAAAPPASSAAAALSGSDSSAASDSPGFSAAWGASGASDDRPIVYWRPGCVFCLRLRVRLGPEAARLRWVDIWQHPAAAAAVREITGGDETVPTVVIGGRGHVNPDPSWLRDQLVPAARS